MLAYIILSAWDNFFSLSADCTDLSAEKELQHTTWKKKWSLGHCPGGWIDSRVTANSAWKAEARCKRIWVYCHHFPCRHFPCFSWRVLFSCQQVCCLAVPVSKLIYLLKWMTMHCYACWDKNNSLVSINMCLPVVVRSKHSVP